LSLNEAHDLLVVASRVDPVAQRFEHHLDELAVDLTVLYQEQVHAGCVR